MQYSLKLLMLGDASVGKTSLVERYVNGTFKEDTRLTIGVQFLFKRLQLGGNAIDLQIWDFGGEERFRFILPSYCLGASGAIFIYDITSPRSLLHLGDWLEVIRERTTNLPILVVGSKVDLELQRQVKLKTAIRHADKHDLLEVLEVSAKNGQNINLAFNSITQMMISNITQGELGSSKVFS
jgi:small GTP-binding protein